MFTLLLATLILNEQLTPGHMGLVIIIILGIVLASTSVAEIRTLLQKSRHSLSSQGVRWAVVATLAFGTMDFGIGASASINGWFLSVIWTRVFSLVFLLAISFWKHHQRLCRLQAAGDDAVPGKSLSLSLPSLEDFVHIRHPLSIIGLGVLLAAAAGIVENAAVLLFSLDTRLATTGLSSAVASSYALVVMVFGLLVYRERLAKNQLFGILMFMSALALLVV